MAYSILFQTYRNDELCDAFSWNGSKAECRGLFEDIRNLPYTTESLDEGALVVDIESNGDLNEDPITIRPGSVDDFIFGYLEMPRDHYEELVLKWREGRDATLSRRQQKRGRS